MRVFIDGREGTTGLRIDERLNPRGDIELILIDDALRKDTAARAECINAADVVFLCLPDDAARQSVELTTNPDSVLIDASTAHRTAPGWAYGMPELGPQFRQAIETGKRIAGPGCHASGFIALVRPLIQAGLLAKTAQLSCLSLTGYTGGGLAKIAEYEDASRMRGDALSAPLQYALGQQHKHLPEICAHAGLAPHAPAFMPVIADYDRGMEVTIPIFDLKRETAIDCYRAFYTGAAMIHVTDSAEPKPANYMRGRDSMEIAVAGNDERLLLIARFDNLGKGAAGAALQCMNLAIGADETEGLVP